MNRQVSAHFLVPIILRPILHARANDSTRRRCPLALGPLAKWVIGIGNERGGGSGNIRLIAIKLHSCTGITVYTPQPSFQQRGDGPKAQRADVFPMLMASEATFHIRNQLKILNYPDINVHVTYDTPLYGPLRPWQPLSSL